MASCGRFLFGIFCAALALSANTQAKTILNDITVTTVTLPSAVSKGIDTLFRYRRKTVQPRPSPIYAEALPNGGAVVAWSSASEVHVTKIEADLTTIASDWTTPGEEARGLVLHADGSVAILVRRRLGSNCACSAAACAGPCGALSFVKFSPAGTVALNSIIDDRIFDFRFGGSSLSYWDVNGTQQYAAFYKITATPNMCASNIPVGSNGDTLKLFPASGPPAFQPSAPVAAPGYCFGCSNSLDQRLALNPTTGDFAAVCLTDTFPSPPGIFLYNKVRPLVRLSGGNGLTDGGLGTVLPRGSGYVMVYTAPRPNAAYSTDGTDVAFAVISGSGRVLSTRFITATPAQREEGAHISPIGSTGNYLVTYYVYRPSAPRAAFLAMVVTKDGRPTMEPVPIQSKTAFGEQDSPFTFPNGDVGWAWTWNNGAGQPPKFPYTTPSALLRITRVKAAGAVSAGTSVALPDPLTGDQLALVFLIAGGVCAVGILLIVLLVWRKRRETQTRYLASTGPTAGTFSPTNNTVSNTQMSPVTAPSTKKAVWQPAVDPNSGATYYYNTITQETTWEKPPGL